MNTQVGRSAGIALLMAVGLLALLFAFGVFSPQGTPGVSAHECQSPGDTHEDNSGDDACTAAVGTADGEHDTGDHLKPVFSMETYSFNVDENKAGSGTGNSPVSLGQVMATHDGGEEFTYSVSAVTGTFHAITDYRIYPDGSLAYVGSSGLNYEETALESDTDGKYAEITVTATEVVPTGGTADVDPSGTAMVRIYVNDVESDPPTSLMVMPAMARAEVTTSGSEAYEITAANATQMLSVEWAKHSTISTDGTYTLQYREMMDGQANDAGWGSDNIQSVAGATPTNYTGGVIDDLVTRAIITGLDAKTDYEVRIRVTKPDPDADDIADEWSVAEVGETVVHALR